MMDGETSCLLFLIGFVFYIYLSAFCYNLIGDIVDSVINLEARNQLLGCQELEFMHPSCGHIIQPFMPWPLRECCNTAGPSANSSFLSRSLQGQTLNFLFQGFYIQIALDLAMPHCC